MTRFSYFFLMLAGFACRGEDLTQAPPESYRLFMPAGEGKEVRPVDIKDPIVSPVPTHLETGFASEMLRTLYLAKQYIRDAQVDGQGFSSVAMAKAKRPVVMVLGKEATPFGVGLQVVGSVFARAQNYPDLSWIPLPKNPAADKAVVQTLSGRLATYIGYLVATAGTLETTEDSATVLIDAYRMAMEVVAREWRFGQGPAGVIQYDEGTQAQRELFANIRENRYVMDENTRALLPAQALVTSAGVAATILYRMAQSRNIGPNVAPATYYAPFAKNRMPEGVSPAAILGPFRNFQAKLLGVWAASVLRKHAPRDILDLVLRYGETFPAERHEAIRIAVVTTFGATARRGGVPANTKDPSQTLAELNTLTAEIVLGKRSLKEALETPPPP